MKKFKCKHCGEEVLECEKEIHRNSCKKKKGKTFDFMSDLFKHFNPNGGK